MPCYTKHMPNDCNSPLHPDALEGIERFNRRQFWFAHEALEDAWNAETEKVREFYRGILQLSVVCFHIRKGNLRGAQKVYARSQKWLKPFPEVCQGVELGRFQRDMAAVMAEAERLGVENLKEFDGYPQITYEN